MNFRLLLLLFSAMLITSCSQQEQSVSTYSSTTPIRDGVLVGDLDANGYTINNIDPSSTIGLSDGDKGDIVVSGSGGTWTIDSGVVTAAKLDTAYLPVDGSVAMSGALELDVEGTATNHAITKAYVDALTYPQFENTGAANLMLVRSSIPGSVENPLSIQGDYLQFSYTNTQYATFVFATSAAPDTSSDVTVLLPMAGTASDAAIWAVRVRELGTASWTSFTDPGGGNTLTNTAVDVHTFSFDWDATGDKFYELDVYIDIGSSTLTGDVYLGGFGIRIP